MQLSLQSPIYIQSYHIIEHFKDEKNQTKALSQSQSVANTARNPLRKFRLPRPREESSVVILIPRITRIGPCSTSGCIVLVFSSSVALLSHVDQHQQYRSQDDNDKTFEETLVNVEV